MGVKIIPRGRLVVSQSGSEPAFSIKHFWEVKAVKLYLVPTASTSRYLAKELIQRRRAHFNLAASNQADVSITDAGGGLFTLRDRNKIVLTSGTIFTTRVSFDGGVSGGTHVVVNPTLENATSYDNCYVNFSTYTAGASKPWNYNWRIYQYGPT